MPLFKKETTYISEHVKVTGDIDAEEKIVIDGDMFGNIRSTTHVVLGGTSHFEGNIKSESALVSGYVKGCIITSKSLEVRVPATIVGDLESASVYVESGVIIQGRVLSKPAHQKSLPETCVSSSRVHTEAQAEVTIEEPIAK